MNGRSVWEAEGLGWEGIPLPLTQTPQFSQITWWFPHPQTWAPKPWAWRWLRGQEHPRAATGEQDYLVENSDASRGLCCKPAARRGEVPAQGSDVSWWTMPEDPI